MEQIESFEYEREGKRYEDNTGTTAEGLPIIWTDHLDADEGLSKGQILRESPDEIRIKFRKDSQGRAILVAIESDFSYVLLANNGDMLLQTAHDRKMSANKQDLLDFATMLWGKAKAFIRNGRVRKLDGHNYMPVAMLDANGNGISIPDAYYNAGNKVVDGVVYTTTSAPVHNYNTHRVDGTAIA